eukprot:6986120-Pyramimonas_sp.AAC.1
MARLARPSSPTEEGTQEQVHERRYTREGTRERTCARGVWIPVEGLLLKVRGVGAVSDAALRRRVVEEPPPVAPPEALVRRVWVVRRVRVEVVVPVPHSVHTSLSHTSLRAEASIGQVSMPVSLRTRLK